MSKKNKKDKRSRPLSKPNHQIPMSSIRPVTTLGSSPYLQEARNYPLHGCWIMAGWQEGGITPAVMAPLQEADRIMFGVYLVDYYCLGIKNAYTRVDYSQTRFERELPKLCADAPVPCSVELANELIYGALEYAKKLGFEPHPDFYREKADLILDPPDAYPRENKLQFGYEGKPLYISGPHDSELKSRSVVNTLMRTCGPGNFDYVVSIGDVPKDMP